MLNKMFNKIFAFILSMTLMLCVAQFADTAPQPFIHIVSGNHQFAGLSGPGFGTPLIENLVVAVTDRQGNPLETDVLFSIYSFPEGSSRHSLGLIVEQHGRFTPDPRTEITKRSTGGIAEIGFRLGDVHGAYKVKAEIVNTNKHVIFYASTRTVYDDRDYIEAGDAHPMGNVNRDLTINNLRIVNIDALGTGTGRIAFEWDPPAEGKAVDHIVVENGKTWFVYYLYEIRITPLQIRVHKGNPMDYEPRCYWEAQVHRGLILNLTTSGYFEVPLERDLEYRESDIGPGDSVNVRDLQPGPSGKPIVFIPSGKQNQGMTTTFRVPYGVYECSVRCYEFRNDKFAYPDAYTRSEEYLRETGTSLIGYHAFGPAAKINANGLGVAALSVVPDGAGGTKWVLPFQIPVPDSSGGTDWVDNTVVPEKPTLPVPSNVSGRYTLDDYGFVSEVTLTWDPIVNNPPVTQYGVQHFDTADTSHPDFPEGYPGGLRTTKSTNTPSITYRFRQTPDRLADFTFHVYASYNNHWSEKSAGYRFGTRRGQQRQQSAPQTQQAPAQSEPAPPQPQPAPARAAVATQASDNFDDPFEGTALQNPNWRWQNQPANWDVGETRDGFLHINSETDRNLWTSDASHFLYQETDANAFDVETHFFARWDTSSGVNGLVVKSPADNNWVTLKFWSRDAGAKGQIQYQTRGQENGNGLTGHAGFTPTFGNTELFLRLRKQGDTYTGWYKTRAADAWREIGVTNFSLTPPLQLGIYAGVAARTGTLNVDYAYFRSTVDTRVQASPVRAVAPIEIPVRTALLPNYPNPFNPETWIPYQLSSASDVTVSIYAVDGNLVRRLSLGHQAAGMYQSRSRAVHWDGKNESGERVSSGVYFYMLSTDKHSLLRKMVILK